MFLVVLLAGMAATSSRAHAYTVQINLDPETVKELYDQVSLSSSACLDSWLPAALLDSQLVCVCVCV
jgi:hypothetical protein